MTSPGLCRMEEHRKKEKVEKGASLKPVNEEVALKQMTTGRLQSDK